MSVLQVWSILWARKWTAIVFALATLIVALTTIQFIPPRYDATAFIYFRMADRDPATNEEVPGMVQRNFLLTQIETIMSRGVALEVVNGLGLHDDPSYKSGFMQSTGGRGDLDNWIAAALTEQLFVDRVGASDILFVRFRDGDPKRAAKFANAFVNAYIKKDIELRARPARDLFQWYEAQLDPLRNRLTELNSRRSDTRRQDAGNWTALASIDREIDSVKAQLTTITDRIERLRLESAVDQSLASRLSNATEPTSPAFPQRRLIAGFALGFGILFGIVIAFLREMFDHRIRSPLDVTEYTELPVLAVVPISRWRRWRLWHGKPDTIELRSVQRSNELQPRIT
jgi:succinoglycan biosynthesis transport protein ExoP